MAPRLPMGKREASHMPRLYSGQRFCPLSQKELETMSMIYKLVVWPTISERKRLDRGCGHRGSLERRKSKQVVSHIY